MPATRRPEESQSRTRPLIARVRNRELRRGGSAALLEKQTAEALKNLPRLGFNVQADPAVVSRLVQIQRRLDAIGRHEKWAERLDGLDDVDFMTKQGIAQLATLLSMTDEECTEWLKLYKEFRKVLRSTLAEPATASARKS